MENGRREKDCTNMARSKKPLARQPAGPLSRGWKQSLRRRLRAWYDRHARDLPWRRNADPYRVWVSEIMLQQTQVATVVPYFLRFLKAFPDVRSLAAADEHQVLRLWEGLGYYRRARQLHAAARTIVDEHGGRFPDDPHLVRRLPGIGRYTAGAILSISMDKRLAILEANTVRLLSRLIAFEGDPRAAGGQRQLWEVAEAILPRRRVGQFNQALMELGSQVCTVRAPHCCECPLSALCKAHLTDRQDAIPRTAPKQNFENVHEAAVVVRRRGEVLLRRCAAGERWAGLWDFPRFVVRAQGGAAARRELVDRVREQTGITIAPVERLSTMRHGVTRFRITLDCHAADYVEGHTRRANGAQLKWVRPTALAEYPLSSTGRRLARLVAEQCEL